MLFAIVNDEKVEALPKTIGKCPLCEQNVRSKCGEIYVWHWAHIKNESCDDWYEPETHWHKNWKLIFGKELCEIVISKDGTKHIADIRTEKGVIIELQNSPILKQVIRRREHFYGEQMIWIINGVHFKENFQISPSKIFEDEQYYLSNNPLAQKMDIISSSIGEQNFIWNRPRRCWDAVQRNVFIDFGGEEIFWVKSGMGSKCGYGKFVTKEKFIKKYGGNLDLISTVIE